jgi:tetratricopeptide (TPR) repeat protein
VRIAPEHAPQLRTMRHNTLWLALSFAVPLGCASPSATERAQALVRTHRESDAAALLRARIHAHPEDVAARRLLVRVLAWMGDLPGARVEVAELARGVSADDPAPYLELGHALELAHRYDEALAAYDDAANAAPGSPEGPREGGMRCARWGEPEAARPRLEEAVRRGAHDAELWHVLGLVRLHAGDLDGAEKAYRTGAASDPKGAENWLGLATLAVMQGDAPKALEAYDELLARRPRFAPAELGRAWALGKLGRTADASRALDRAEALGAPATHVARQRAVLAPVKTGEKQK